MPGKKGRERKIDGKEKDCRKNQKEIKDIVNDREREMNDNKKRKKTKE